MKWSDAVAELEPPNAVTMTSTVPAAWAGLVAVIDAGVRVGETVVTDGQMTLKSGSLARARKAPGQQQSRGPANA